MHASVDACSSCPRHTNTHLVYTGTVHVLVQSMVDTDSYHRGWKYRKNCCCVADVLCVDSSRCTAESTEYSRHSATRQPDYPSLLPQVRADYVQQYQVLLLIRVPKVFPILLLPDWPRGGKKQRKKMYGGQRIITYSKKKIKIKKTCSYVCYTIPGILRTYTISIGRTHDTADVFQLFIKSQREESNLFPCDEISARIE